MSCFVLLGFKWWEQGITMISCMWLHILIVVFIGTLEAILVVKGFSPQKSGEANRQAKGFLSNGPLMVEVLLDCLEFRNRRNI